MQQRRKPHDKGSTASAVPPSAPGIAAAAASTTANAGTTKRPVDPEPRTSALAAIDLPQGFVDTSGTTVSSSPPSQSFATGARRGHSPSSKYRRGEHPTEASERTFWCRFSLLATVAVVAGFVLLSRHEEEQMVHLRESIVQNQIQPLEHQWQARYRALQDETSDLRRQLEQKASELDTVQHTNTLNTARAESLTKDLGHLKKYKRFVNTEVQKMSATIALEKFGPGPHRVEINVTFVEGFPKLDETDDSVGNDGTIVLELAPIEEMPHTVHWFLEQVTRGLYDYCSFHRNAGHVMQGGPAPSHLTPVLSDTFHGLRTPFTSSGFKSVLTQEYSKKWPHKKYTIGYAGRPGGPDFYISTVDNSKLHGPGGQTNYDDPTEADPCFGRVIQGHEVVDRMQLGPVKPGNYRALVDNVAIRSMRLIGYNDKTKSTSDHQSHDDKDETDKDAAGAMPKSGNSSPDPNVNPYATIGAPEREDLANNGNLGVDFDRQNQQESQGESDRDSDGGGSDGDGDGDGNGGDDNDDDDDRADKDSNSGDDLGHQSSGEGVVADTDLEQY